MNKKISKFLNKKNKEIQRLGAAYPDKMSLVVDYDELEDFDKKLAEELLNNPDGMIAEFETQLNEMDIPTQYKDPVFHVRFTNLPEEYKVMVRNVVSETLTKLIPVDGVVNKTSDILPKVSVAYFVCNRCGEGILLKQDDKRMTLKEPLRCENCERQDFRFVPEKSKFRDIRRLEIQEPLELLHGGEQASRIMVWTEDDMTDEMLSMPGSRIEINCIPRLLPPKHKKGTIYSKYIDANYIKPVEQEFGKIEIDEEEEKEIKKLANDSNIYEKIINSIAPSIYGHKEVKEAIALQLFGGRYGKKLPDGTTVRPDIHVLLIGEPGVAKCVDGETRVLLSEGDTRRIRDVVEGVIEKNKNEIDDGFYGISNHDILSMGLNGTINEKKSDIFWKRESPEYMYKVTTQTGRSVTVTPTHPLFVPLNGKIVSKKAEELQEGEYIATPRKIPITGRKQKIKAAFNKGKTNAKHIKIPEETSPEFSRFIAYVIAEGYARRTETTHEIMFTNNDDLLNEDFMDCARELFGISGRVVRSHKSKTAKAIILHSIELGRFLKSIDKDLFSRSSKKRVPRIIMRSSNEEITEFLRVYFDCESWVDKERRTIFASSASKDLLGDVRILLARFGILSQIHSMRCRASNSAEPKWRDYYRLTITGEDVLKFAKKIGFSILEKKNRLRDLINSKKIYNTNMDVVPNVCDILKEIRKGLRLTQFQCGISRGAYQHFERGDREPSRKALIKVIETFQKRIDDVKKILPDLDDFEYKNLENVRNTLNIPQGDLASLAGVSQTLVSWYGQGKIKTGKRKTIEKIINALRSVCLNILDYENEIFRLEAIANSDVFWDKVVEIQRVKSKEKWVYDLQVENTHNFIANDIFVHNSRILQYVDQIAPKSIYVSGKGTTAGGLCIAPDTFVMTNPGEVDRIDNIVEEKLNNNTHEYSNGVWQAKNPADDKKILTLNEDLECCTRMINQFWRISPPKKMISITTKMGKNIIVTPNTKLSTINGGEIIWKKSSTFTPGEYIATARNLTVNNHSNHSKKLTIELIKSNPVVYGVKDIINDMINILVKKYGTKRELARRFDFKEDGIYYKWVNEKARSNIHLDDLKKLAKDSNTSLSEIAPHITGLSLYHGKKITIPPFLNKDLLYFAGLVAGDGSIYKHKHENIVTIRFTNKNENLLQTFKNLSQSLFNVKCDPTQNTQRTSECRFHSKLVFEILESLGIPESPKSNKIDLSNILLELPDESIAIYIRGLYDTDGSVTKTKSGGNSLELYTTSEKLAKKLVLVLLRFGIMAKLGTRDHSKGSMINNRLINSKYKVYVLSIRNSTDIKLFDKFIGFAHKEKNKKIKKILNEQKGYHTNVDIIPEISSILKNVRNVFNLTEGKLNRKYLSNISGERNPNRKTVLNFVEIAKQLKDDSIKVAIPNNLRKEIYDKLSQKLSRKEIYDKFKITDYSFYDYFMRYGRPVRIPLKLLTEISLFLDDESILDKTTPDKKDITKAEEDLNKLEKLAKSDIFWDEVSDVNVLENHNYGFVYDFTAEDAHSFLANGILVHNTAIAERDEFADGAWTLKAGALVIAGGGVVCIDEFDKIEKTDRAAMHEALEQQSVSVAKAGIITKFKANASVLAAANPKFSRFDSYKPIGEQFDILPTLLSRFDLIFPIKDILDEEQDRRIAEHILKMHKGNEAKELAPEIPTDLFKRYIAYARQNINPMLSEDAANKIKEYYVTLRSSARGGEGAVPATPRQLEALIRLSEASAKVRLSNTATVSDAGRAIELTNFCLRAVAMDYETGELDIDRVVTTHPKSQRDKIRTIEDIIKKLIGESEYKLAGHDDVVNEAESMGIDRVEVEKVILELKNKGIIYEPKNGKYSWVP
ncbi:MAG: hypothetical protein A7316_07705 [Candidatus Altiarchaeales archaeon WOR_SM1_86-2]|nr:MAG: hypothetical protein A7316_07705 [Candidatus Altiarchaeales archaeon WOR_SM1_86-2]ODS41544.1 MAG: hypothetical protein A7315_05790 [Candidatus Altiarchaeales archaeon WOR_SM1_79]